MINVSKVLPVQSQTDGLALATGASRPRGVGFALQVNLKVKAEVKVAVMAFSGALVSAFL